MNQRLASLAHLVRAVGAQLPDTDDLAAARVLVQRGETRLSQVGFTVVAIAGATGSGKSTLFNALAGLPLSPPGHLRPTTAAVHACVWAGADPTDPLDATALLDWLRVAPDRRFRRESALDGPDEASLRGLVLLDLPDVDSVAPAHRVEAARLVGLVDLVIWVLDPQKYADQAIHGDHLRHLGALREVTMVLLNQIDRLTPEDAARCREDLARLVAADGLDGAPVLATSALTGSGLGEVRALLEQVVAGRAAARTRIDGELAATVAQVSPLVGGTGVDEATIRTAIATLADDLAVAVGVDGLAIEAGLRQRHRASLARRAPRARPEPAPPADLAPSMRRFAATLATDLPGPWADRLHEAAETTLDQLPSAVGEATTAALPAPTGRGVWTVLRVAWLLGLLTVIGEAVWLVRGGGSPVVAAVAGALAVLLPPIAAVAARLSARRAVARTRIRLREATLAVAREAATEPRAILRDHDVARAALVDLASR